MSEDQFTKLFKYMQEQFRELRSEVNGRFNDVDQKFDRIYGIADTVLKNQEGEQHEQAAIVAALDRHEELISRHETLIHQRVDETQQI